MKSSILMISLWCLAYSSVAQSECNLNISGRVIDEHDGSNLGFANIYVENTQIGTTSDAFGQYTLSGLCVGKYVVVCSHIGCEPVRDTLLIEGNMNHNFYPEHHTELLEGVTVIQEVTPMSEYWIDRLKPSAKTGGKTLGQAVESIAGVSNLSTGNSISKPIIHGLHSNRVLVMNNGVRQEGQQWGNEHAPEIDPFIAGEIQVYKGAQSVRFGPDAIGGVILVSPKSLPDSFGISGGIALSGRSNGMGGSGNSYFEGRWKKVPAFRWRVQGSGKKLGDAHAPSYVLTNTGVEELNFSANASLSDERKGVEVFYSQFNSNLGILAASHIGNLTDLQYALRSDTPLVVRPFSYLINRPYQHVEHELFKATSYFKTESDLDVRMIYGRQYNLREEFDNHISSNPSVPGLQFEIVTHSVDLIVENAIAAKHHWQVGATGLFQENTYEGRYFIPAFRKWNTGIFMLDQVRLNTNWSAEFGGRFDYVSQSFYLSNRERVEQQDRTFNQPSVTAGIIRKIGKKWQWKLNAANAWRPPTANELYSNGLHHGAATFEIGDASLGKEVSYSANTAAIYLSERWRVETEVYANYMDGFIYLAPQLPATLTIRGAFPTYAYDQTSALLYGLDNQIRFKANTWLSLISSTSVLRARDVANGNWIVQMPADQSTLAAEFTRENRDYSLYATPSIRWVNKQWRVPANSDYVAPPEAYLLANFIAGVSRNTKLGNTELNVEINNLLNQRYRNYMNRYRYYADEIGTNIIVRIAHHF